MEDLEKFEKVNECESLLELADVIRSFGEDGVISGRDREFSSEKMARLCEGYSLDRHNVLTREFGIRQQAMYILFYDNL